MLYLSVCEDAPADLKRQSPQGQKGGRWIRYLVGCLQVLQALTIIGNDCPAVMFALARGEGGHTTRLVIDVLLFSLSVRSPSHAPARPSWNHAQIFALRANS